MATIRQLQAKDWELLQRLRLAALQDSPRAFGSTLAQEAGFDETRWRRRLVEGVWLVAEIGPDAVGLIAGFPRGEPGCPGYLVVSMWVSPGARGSGAAGQLVSDLIRHAKLGGARWLELTVVEDDLAARRLYQHHGFQATGELEPYPHVPGLMEVHMRLELAP